MIIESRKSTPDVNPKKMNEDPFDDSDDWNNHKYDFSKVSAVIDELPLLSGEQYNRVHIRKNGISVKLINNIPESWDSRNPRTMIAIDRIKKYSFEAGSTITVELTPGNHTFAVLSKNNHILAKPFSMYLDYGKSYVLSFQRDAITSHLTFFVRINHDMNHKPHHPDVGRH